MVTKLNPFIQGPILLLIRVSFPNGKLAEIIGQTIHCHVFMIVRHVQSDSLAVVSTLLSYGMPLDILIFSVLRTVHADI